MTIQESLDKLKALVTRFEAAVPAEPNPEPQPEEFTEGTLKDGTVIKYDKLEAGGKVVVITEGGEVQAPEGDHELADGTVVSIDANGTITAVKPAEPKAEEPAADEPKAEFISKEDFEAVKASIAELKAENKDLKEQLESKIADQFAIQKATSELMEELMKEPGAAPVQTPKTFLSEKASGKQAAKENFITSVQKLK